MIEKRQKLILGTVQFGLPYGIANNGGKVSQTMIEQILNSARNAGISTLDTAIAYGDSEKALGLQDLQGFAVITKLFETPNSCSDINDWVRNQLFASLERLKLDSLDTLLFHRPMQLLDSNGEKLYQAVLSLKEQGLIKRIGMSMDHFEGLSKITEKFDFDVVQAPMNIIDQRMDTSGLLTKLKNAGVEIHVRSAFLQGVLLMNFDQIPEYFQPWNDLFNAYHSWLKVHDISPLQACLGYLNQHAKVDRIVVGVDSLIQLEEIIDAINKPALEIPNFFQSSDDDLINPSRWKV
jgi:hypothetical protein